MSGAPLNALSLAPQLTCGDIQKSITFYVDGLGFEIIHKMEREGKLEYVALKGGGAQLGLGQDDFKKGKDRVKGTGVRVWITTDQDIVALAGHATAAGLTLDDGPVKQEWGPMSFSLTDPDGFKVSVSGPWA